MRPLIRWSPHYIYFFRVHAAASAAIAYFGGSCFSTNLENLAPFIYNNLIRDVENSLNQQNKQNFDRSMKQFVLP